MSARVALAICVMIAVTSMSAQRDAATTARPNERPLLDRTKPDQDVHKWLEENASLLSRGDACTLREYWANADIHYKGPSGSWYGLVSFVVLPEDEEVVRVIRDEKQNLDVAVGVRYLPVQSGLSGVTLALAFEGNPGDVFSQLNRSEASGFRDKSWRYIEVVKPIQVGSVRYTYSLFCENGRTFLSFLKKPPKHNRNKP